MHKLYDLLARFFKGEIPKRDGRDWLDLKKVLLPIDARRELAWYDGGL